MKKLLMVLAVLLAGAGSGKAQIQNICTDWGQFNLCLPITSGIDAAFGYDFRGHRSQGLAETPFASWNMGLASKLVFKGGGITTDNGKGAPFLGADYELR